MNNLLLLANFWEEEWFIIVIIIGGFAVLAALTFSLYKFLTRKKPNKNTQSSEDIAQEELDRILEPYEETPVSADEEDFQDTIALEEEQKKQNKED